MRVIIWLLHGLNWLLSLLPQKPRDEEQEIWSLMQPAEAPPAPMPAPVTDQNLFKPISRSQVQQAREFIRFKEKEDAYRKAQAWSHIAVPRHKRDLDLVNRLKREGRL